MFGRLAPPRRPFAAFFACHDPSILYEAGDDWVPGDGTMRLADESWFPAVVP
jgi:hypothetical protein